MGGSSNTPVGHDHIQPIAKDTSVSAAAAAESKDKDVGSLGLNYVPLAKGTKQFRLLTVLPAGAADAPLECLVHVADLSSGGAATTTVPEYETISYCWGDAAERSVLVVDGEAVSVPASAAMALRRVRRPDSTRVVWLDAVCINQRDDDERSRQVSMMGDIYRHGAGNLIYLGEQDIGPAVASMAAILDEIHAEGDALTQLRNEMGAWQYSNTAIKAQYDHEALFDLYSIAWFRRLWVLQEAALARRNLCFCGQFELDLVDVTRVAAWLVYNYYFVDPGLRIQCSYAADMNDLVDKTYGYHRLRDEKPPSSLYLLDLAQQRLSSVAVDKVYGILGLAAGQSSGLKVAVDYRKTAAEVFRDAAWCLIRQDENLQVLDYVRHWTDDDDRLDLDGFSSWVPKWHRSKDLDEHPNFMSLSFDAGAGRKAVLDTWTDKTPEVLRVKGIRLGEVRHATGRVQASKEEQGAALDRLIDRAEGMISTPSGSGNNRGQPDPTLALSIATCMVAGVDSSYKAVGPEVVRGFRAFRECVRNGTLPVSIHDANNDKDGQSDRDGTNVAPNEAVLASQYAEAMWNACMNRSFFTMTTTTDSSMSSVLFGLGPYFMKPGDVVAILYGFQYPAILRPLEEGEFLFLGVAYVQGVMSGESVRQHELSGSSDTGFSIR
jgi:hypothetical protein